MTLPVFCTLFFSILILMLQYVFMDDIANGISKWFLKRYVKKHCEKNNVTEDDLAKDFGFRAELQLKHNQYVFMITIVLCVIMFFTYEPSVRFFAWLFGVPLV